MKKVLCLIVLILLGMITKSCQENQKVMMLHQGDLKVPFVYNKNTKVIDANPQTHHDDRDIVAIWDSLEMVEHFDRALKD